MSHKRTNPKSPSSSERDRTTDVLAYIGAGLALLGFLFYVVLGLIFIIGMQMADR